MTVRRVLCIAALVIAATGCNAERQRLIERQAELDRQRAVIERRIGLHREALRETRQRLDELRARLAEHDGNAQAYIVQHQTAAACIRAAAITLGDDNQYRAQVGAMARIGTVLCTVALLNQQFASEVAQVASSITQADKVARELKADIASMETTLAANQSRIHEEEQQRDRIDTDLDDVRQRIPLQ